MKKRNFTDMNSVDHGMIDLSKSDDSPNAEVLAPMNEEETHVMILERNITNHNHSYQCKYCSHKFIGGASKMKAHLCDGKWSSVRVTACTGKKPQKTLDRIADITLKRDKEIQLKRSPGSEQKTLRGCFAALDNQNLEMAILAFLASNNIAPNVALNSKIC